MSPGLHHDITATENPRQNCRNCHAAGVRGQARRIHARPCPADHPDPVLSPSRPRPVAWPAALSQVP